MRIPLSTSAVADATAEFITSLPVNLEIVPTNNNIAEAQYRMTSGAISSATGPGIDRGGILWNDVMYRVMGTKLCSVSQYGVVTQIGDVGGTGPVGMDFSFDRLAIRSGTNLFYLKDGTLTQVTDPNLGPVIDMMWIDGYFMTTDGTSVVVTDLTDPTKVIPLHYGSAEEDPDAITGLIKISDEATVLGRDTIQVLENVGGLGFPFANIKTASITIGCVGPLAKCLFDDTFAFVGSARNEAIGVYLAGQGSATRISNRRIDDELAKVADPSTIILENRTSRAERRLLVHLPDKTLVFLANASRTLQEVVWVVAQSGEGQPYRLRNSVLAYGNMYVGDTQSAQIGQLTDAVSTQFGEVAEWRFDAGPVYNGGKGAILTSVELIGLPGRGESGGTVFLSLTRDGENWSVERSIPMGDKGELTKRLQWRPRVNMRTWLGLRFRGYNSALPGFAALEAGLEPLNA